VINDEHFGSWDMPLHHQRLIQFEPWVVVPHDP
jgi:hypothetical protein